MEPIPTNNINLTLIGYGSSRGESFNSNLQESGETQVIYCYDYVLHKINAVTQRLLAMPTKFVMNMAM